MAFVPAPRAVSQVTNSCPTGKAVALLEVNNVRANVFNNGLLWGGSGSSWIYEVPKGSGLTGIWHASVVIGGLVEGQLRTAATLYAPPEFWPGPLDDQARPTHDCRSFDRLYQITRRDIERYYETGIGTPDLFQWPYYIGAPVVDGDGDLDNYNLDGGDRPALVGDQMLWWVMNDAGGEHARTKTLPLGMEVQGTAFAYRANNYLGTTTFYRYRLLYKGHAPLTDAYFGIVSDTRHTDGDRRYVGTDTTLSLAYVYYVDNFDERNWDEDPAYGEAPPALGFAFLRTPNAEHDRRDNDHDGQIDEPGEQQGLTTTIHHYNGGGVSEDPVSAQDFYNYLRARWKDGQPLTVGGHGRGSSNIVTRYAFPGDPVTGTFWSAVNCDGAGTPCGWGVRYLMATGPFSMQPGDELEIVFALVWSRGDDYLDSVRQLRDDVHHLHGYADVLLEPVSISEPKPTPQHLLGFAQNYPNPFSRYTTIRYSLPQSMYVRLKVFDVLGREVAMLVEGQQDGGIYETSFVTRDLPAGLYFYRIEMDHLTSTRRMVLVR